MTPSNNKIIKSEQLEPNLWYPHYYSSLLWTLTKEGGHLSQKKIIPDIQRHVEQVTDSEQRETLIVLGCLLLGFNLGVFLAKKQKQSKHKQFAENFSLYHAQQANLRRFDSRYVRSLYGVFQSGETVKELFQAHLYALQKEDVLHFLITETKLSNSQLYHIINHSNRLASLLILLNKQKDRTTGKETFFIEAKQDRYQQIFELKSVNISSPGAFQLMFHKSYEWLKKYLPSVRTALKKLPLLDLHIEKEQARLAAETDQHQAEQAKARLEKKITELQEKIFDDYAARVTEQLADSHLKKQLQSRLKESARALSQHGVKIPK